MNCTVTTSLTSTVKLVRLVETRLLPTELELNIDLDIDDDGDILVSKLNKIRNWIQNYLNGCIAFNVSSEMETQFFGECENDVMFCPEDPQDHLLLMLIVSKINAIGEGIVSVANASIWSDGSQGFSYSLDGDPLEWLPKPEEWMGEKRYYDQAWWNRPDGSMVDVPYDENTDIDKDKPDILIDLDPEPVKIETDTISTGEEGSAEIIRLNFKPRLVPNDS